GAFSRAAPAQSSNRTAWNKIQPASGKAVAAATSVNTGTMMRRADKPASDAATLKRQAAGHKQNAKQVRGGIEADHQRAKAIIVDAAKQAAPAAGATAAQVDKTFAASTPSGVADVAVNAAVDAALGGAGSMVTMGAAIYSEAGKMGSGQASQVMGAAADRLNATPSLAQMMANSGAQAPSANGFEFDGVDGGDLEQIVMGDVSDLEEVQAIDATLHDLGVVQTNLGQAENAAKDRGELGLLAAMTDDDSMTYVSAAAVDFMDLPPQALDTTGSAGMMITMLEMPELLAIGAAAKDSAPRYGMEPTPAFTQSGSAYTPYTSV
ncbi:MAG: hypothetical protein ACPGRX_05180, partial [Bdellovibrionales bacterium]